MAAVQPLQSMLSACIVGSPSCPTQLRKGFPSVVQAAKTYLERKFEEFPSCDVDALMQHGLKVSYLLP